MIYEKYWLRYGSNSVSLREKGNPSTSQLMVSIYQHVITNKGRLSIFSYRWGRSDKPWKASFPLDQLEEAKAHVLKLLHIKEKVKTYKEIQYRVIPKEEQIQRLKERIFGTTRYIKAVGETIVKAKEDLKKEKAKLKELVGAGK